MRLDENSLFSGWFQIVDRGVTHEVMSCNHVAEEQRNGQLGDGHSESVSEEAIFLEPLSTVHSIILDWTPASFIDSVGAKAIKQVPPFVQPQVHCINSWVSGLACCSGKF